MISSDWFFLGWALAMVFALLWLDAREAARRARRAAHLRHSGSGFVHFDSLERRCSSLRLTALGLRAVAQAKARRLANRRAEGVAR
ncbi:MAG: hypothetical protein KDG50_03295 [Chromatiales bacterium]|nr:hypothetical protein [Chromatiales bacterium]